MKRSTGVRRGGGARSAIQRSAHRGAGKSNAGARRLITSFEGLPARVGLRSDPYPNRRSLILARLGFAFAAMGVLRLAGAAENSWATATSLVVGFACCLAIVITLIDPHVFTPGVVRIEIDGAQRRISFRSIAALVVDWLAFAVIMLWATAAGAFLIVQAETDGTEFSLLRMPPSVFVVLGLGAFAIAHLVRRHRRASQVRTGLHVTPDAISCAGGGPAATVPWRTLHRASIERPGFGAARLVLLDADRRRLGAVSVRCLGSDPMVTAAFLHYFRDRPEERELLADPERAIAKFRRHLEHLEGE